MNLILYTMYYNNVRDYKASAKNNKQNIQLETMIIKTECSFMGVKTVAVFIEMLKDYIEIHQRILSISSKQ